MRLGCVDAQKSPCELRTEGAVIFLVLPTFPQRGTSRSKKTQHCEQSRILCIPLKMLPASSIPMELVQISRPLKSPRQCDQVPAERWFARDRCAARPGAGCMRCMRARQRVCLRAQCASPLLRPSQAQADRNDGERSMLSNWGPASQTDSGGSSVTSSRSESSVTSYCGTCAQCGQDIEGTTYMFDDRAYCCQRHRLQAVQVRSLPERPRSRKHWECPLSPV